MCDKVLALPMKLGLVKKEEVFFGDSLVNLTLTDLTLLGGKRDDIRKEQFARYNMRGDGKMSLDEFLAFSMENIFKKILLDD